MADVVKLPVERTVAAPDGSDVRVLAAIEGHGSCAHFELAPGAVSVPVRHDRVSEIWYVLAGAGEMWQQASDGASTVVALDAGSCLTIPVATAFQFRSTGTDPLQVVGVTMPPWPEDGDAHVVTDGAPWTPTVEPGPGLKPA